MEYAELYEYILCLENHISKRFNKTIYFNVNLIPLKDRDGYDCFVEMIGEIKTEKKFLYYTIERQIDLKKLEKLMTIVVKNSLDSNTIDAHEKLFLNNHTSDVQDKKKCEFNKI